MAGILDTDQLRENMRAMTEPFEEPDARLLAQYINRFGPLYCRMCGHCKGASPIGVIADALMIRITPISTRRHEFDAGSAFEPPEAVCGVEHGLPV